LQSLFKNRLVKKQYVALLDGVVNMPPDNCLINYEEGGRGLRLGVIRLPLCPNLDDRPRQMVSYESGKPALTYYEVVSVGGEQSRVNFYPQTGRTHQLRVHAASPDGMDAPIVGDTLYGRKAQRLYLHAESLSLVHPVTHEVLSLTCKPDF
jgi:tRNA pseudouridine32 synthase/23S rRNA pseudouridine746 synthase